MPTLNSELQEGVDENSGIEIEVDDSGPFQFLSYQPGNPAPPEHVRLAEAIKGGDLDEAKAAVKDVDVPRLCDFTHFILDSGNKSNEHVVRYLRDTYKLSISDVQIAVMSGNVENVSALLLQDEGITVETEAGPKSLGPLVTVFGFHTPLRLAIARKDVEMVKLLLEKGANPNDSLRILDPSLERADGTPLKMAITVGNPEIVRLLLDAGAPVQESTMGYVPTDPNYYVELWGLTRKERQQKYDEAIAAGHMIKDDIESANEFGPMSKAIGAGRAAVVQVLLEAGADPNVSIGGKTTPLHMAIQMGHPAIVKLLIDAGADVNKPDAQGRSPLSLGYQKGDIADMLRAAGAKFKIGVRNSD